jgi:hypothetical protein
MTLSTALVIFPVNTSEMVANTIYLDGAVRGTVINLELNSFSFDHHGPGVRFDKTSAALQVALAIIQGLDLKNITNLVVSSIDADSVLATMVCYHPEVCQDLRFIQFLQDVSRIDNHGLPAAVVGEALYGCFFTLRAGRGEEESQLLLLNKVARAWSMYLDGTLYDTSPPRKLKGIALALDVQGSVVERTSGPVDFSDIYAHSGWGVLLSRETTGKWKVTVGKKPFTRVKNLKTLWERFNALEGGWGGADSIGGSPFREGTRFTEDEVLLHIQEWLQ